jgi:poly-gamma-glutamate synthesis protein (capsule biosynthesis protein)
LCLALKDFLLSGFDFLITANNHSLDRGKKGLERTIAVLDQLKIEHTGTFKDEKTRNENYPFIKILKNKKIAILNYTYGTNGLKVEFPNIVNAIDTNQIRKDIQKAKSLKSDFILLTLHWGSEYQRNYNSAQSNLAQWLCDEGADAIIGMHPHVIQPMEIMHPKNDKTKNVPIAYSLGNYVSNQRDQYKNGGIGVGLELSIKNGELKFEDWTYLPFWVHLGGKPKGYYVVPISEWESNPSKFNLNPTEEKEIKQFGSDTRGLLIGLKEMKL